MSTIDESTCQACGSGPGTLSLSQTLVAKPLGTWSLAGAQMKTSAILSPVLKCSACGLRLVGHFDADRGHVTFPVPEPREPLPPQTP